MLTLHVLVNNADGYIVSTDPNTPFTGSVSQSAITTTQTGVSFEPTRVKYDFGQQKFINRLKKYKLYELIDKTGGASHSNRVSPKLIDYKTGLTQNAHPYREFTNGFLTKVTWYKEHDNAAADPEHSSSYSEPVIDVGINYNIGANDFVTDRTTTRKWYHEDGTLSADTGSWKVTTKHYTNEGAMKEGRRRRNNIIVKLQKDVVGMIMITHPSTLAEAQTYGQDFFIDFYTEITLYEQINHRSASVGISTDGILDKVTQAPIGQYPWINNDLAAFGLPGVSIKSYIGGSLDY